jgi:3-oxoacyl-(acyl-carrier-protein) synthase
MKKNRVVITGLGVVSPLGLGIQETFDGLVEKRCGIEKITAFDAAGFTSRIAGAVTAGAVKDCVPKGYRKATKVMARDIEPDSRPSASSTAARPTARWTSIRRVSAPTSAPD